MARTRDPSGVRAPERRTFLAQLAGSCTACALAGMRPGDAGAAPLGRQDPTMGLTSNEEGGLNPRPARW